MTHLNSDQAAELMRAQTQLNLPDNTPMYFTENHYWVADLENGTAILLLPESTGEDNCLIVEEVDDLEELLVMIENGELAYITEFDGTDEEWEALCHGDHHD